MELAWIALNMRGHQPIRELANPTFVVRYRSLLQMEHVNAAKIMSENKEMEHNVVQMSV